MSAVNCEVCVVSVAPPCGERGLKSPTPDLYQKLMSRSPLRGAWIEIMKLLLMVMKPCKSLPLVGSVD